PAHERIRIVRIALHDAALFSVSLEIICRKRYPFASAWQRFLLYRLQNSALAKLEGEHQLFWGLVRSAEFFANCFSRQRKGAVSPAEAIRRKPHSRIGRKDWGSEVGTGLIHGDHRPVR
ncbi:hypothetical protein, partial [Paraburkholderia elongata]|uniref:hypothetical protein n=1 Tax=Paraburkholderia elongata TaxID=2675747 RepID=UPI001C12F2E3